MTSTVVQNAVTAASSPVGTVRITGGILPKPSPINKTPLIQLTKPTTKLITIPSSPMKSAGFMTCILLGICAVVVAFAVLELNGSRSFELLYGLGISFIVFSSLFYPGVMKQLDGILTVHRLPFVLIFFALLCGSLWSAIALDSPYVAVALFALQMFIYLWYIHTFNEPEETEEKVVGDPALRHPSLVDSPFNIPSGALRPMRPCWIMRVEGPQRSTDKPVLPVSHMV